MLITTFYYEIDIPTLILHGGINTLDGGYTFSASTQPTIVMIPKQTHQMLSSNELRYVIRNKRLPKVNQGQLC